MRVSSRLSPQKVSLAILFLAFGLTLILAKGLSPVWVYLNDVVALLDGGWRVYHGQVPHRDFYSVVGPYPLGVLGLSFTIAGGKATGLPLVLALLGLVFSGSFWWLTKSRLPCQLRLSGALFFLFLPCAATFLGGGSGPPFGFRSATTYAMLYNRLGWSALALLMANILIPRAHAGPSSGRTPEAIIAGVLLALCVFSKINFLLAGIGLVTWRLVVEKEDRPRFLIAAFIGFAIATAILSFYPGGTFGSFKDNLTLFQVERTESFFAKLSQRISGVLGWVVTIMAIHLWTIVEKFRSRRDRPLLDLTTGLGVFVALGLGLFVSTLNFEGPEIPALVVAALVASAYARQMNTLRRDKIRIVAADGLAVILALNYVAFDLGSLIYANRWKSINAATAYRLSGPVLSEIPVPVLWSEKDNPAQIGAAIRSRPMGENVVAADMMSSLQYSVWIESGSALLRDHYRKSDHVFVADWFNPFNLSLGASPASGGALLWDYKRMVDDSHHPSTAATLRDVTLFMVPKFPTWGGQREFMLRTYGQELGDSFSIVGENSFWTLWRQISPSRK